MQVIYVRGNVHKVMFTNVYFFTSPNLVLLLSLVMLQHIIMDCQEVFNELTILAINKNIQIKHINAISYAKLFLPSDFLQ